MQDSRTRVQEGDLEVGIRDSEEMQAVHRVGGCTVPIQSLVCDMRLCSPLYLTQIPKDTDPPTSESSFQSNALLKGRPL